MATITIEIPDEIVSKFEAIEGYRAIIQYDPDIEMFRGEFIGLNGSADFYAKDINGLHKEGKISLKVFLNMCKEDCVEPRKS